MEAAARMEAAVIVAAREAAVLMAARQPMCDEATVTPLCLSMSNHDVIMMQS